MTGTGAGRRPVVAVSPLPPMLEPLAELFERAGCEVRRLTGDRDRLDDVDALAGIFTASPVTAEVLQRAPRLRVVTSPIIGTETIDVAACTERAVVVAFGATPENYEGVAEAVVMLTAALRKRLVQKMAAAVDGSWRPASGVGNMVRGATVGLVGYGAIGRATAARFAGWGCRLVTFDPYVDPAVPRADGVAPVGSLEELLAAADVVSLMVTLTEETRGLIDAAALAAMKPGAVLINTARGPVVDEDALLDALDRGHLGGAAIDTWASEGPGTSSALRGHPLVIATGHNVGHSEELYAGHPPAAVDNTLRALRAEPPRYVRNPEVLDRWRARAAALQTADPIATSPVTPTTSAAQEQP
ncbi:MAG: NAD(P)-dependent oxidoreductase [Acidimicrobiales bacterium]